jgi:hypothetical protein
MFHSETAAGLRLGQKQKGGENGFVLTSRGGGVLHDNTLGGPAALPCQAGLRPHSRLLLQLVRRLTTKELVFLRFVAPPNAGVNGKKTSRSIGKMRLLFNSLQVLEWPPSSQTGGTHETREGSLLDHQSTALEGGVHFAADAAIVKQSPVAVPETLKGLRASL